MEDALKLFETSDGARLAYDEAGAGEGVLLVHGLGLSRRRWQRQFEALGAGGYRVVRFDLRGFGDSPLPDEAYDIDRLVADIDELATELDLVPLHLVGHSLGGMIAQTYAVRRPETLRSLTLLSTTSHNGRRASAFGTALAAISERGFDAAVNDPEVRGTVDAVMAQAFPDGGAPPIEHFRHGLEDPNPAHAYGWRVTVDFSVKDELHRIACPVLVMHGTADPLIPFRLGAWLGEALPKATFVALEGAGHSVQVERAEDVTAAILEHLDGA